MRDGLATDYQQDPTATKQSTSGLYAACANTAYRDKTFEEKLDEFFTYHSPSPEQQLRLIEVREAAKSFAHVLARHVPNGSDRTAAARKLREAVMTANAAIVLNGLSL